MDASDPSEAAAPEPDDSVRHVALKWVNALTELHSVRRIGIAVIVIVLALRLTSWLFIATRHFLFLLLLAWLAAVAMEPAVGWLARRKWRRGLATGVVMLTLLILVCAFFAIFGNLLIEQIVSLVKSFPDALTSFIDWINRTFSTSFDPAKLTDVLHLTPTDVADWAQKLGLGVFGFFTSLVGIVFDFFIVLLFAFYFSADGPRLRRFLASWLPQETQRLVNNVWEVAVQKTGGYVASRLILAVLSAACTSLFLLVVGVPYWLPLGIWTGVVSQFIPTLGTYLGGALPVLFAFGQSVGVGIAVIVFILVYQQIENYLFAPKISQRTMDIHPAVAFGSVVVGAAVGGAMGALIAIPIVASIQSLIETYGRRYELIPELAPSEGHPLGHRSEVPKKPRTTEIERRSDPGGCPHVRRGLVEAQPTQLLGVALPVFGHFDAQVEEDRDPDELLDLLPGIASDLSQPSPLVADDDAFLTWPFDEERCPHIGQRTVGRSVVSRHDLLNDHRDGVRELITDSFKRGFSNQLPNADELGFVRHLIFGEERLALWE